MATDAVGLAQALIRFDTTNPPGNEGACVAWAERLLRDAGLETRMVERREGRPNLVARLRGEGAVPPLLLHAHVDVVPATEPGWTVPPFEGVVRDGCLWGRGALDMKGGLAMMLSALMRARADGVRLPGDVVLAIVADEELGGRDGAGFIVERHPNLLGGVRYALGEGGGATVEVAGLRLYPIQVAEKAYVHARATVTGPGGHGSLPRAGGTLARLGRLLERLDGRRLPVRVTPVARLMAEALATRRPELAGLADPLDADYVLDGLGPEAAILDAALHNTVNPTVVRAGAAANVVPTNAAVDLDCRLLPGVGVDELLEELRPFVRSGAELEVLKSESGTGAVVDMTLLDELARVASELDPSGVPVPMLDASISDARFFARLGIQTYGFVPMSLPAGFDRYRLVHAPDERVPLEALKGGAEALYRALPRLLAAQLVAPSGQGTGLHLSLGS